ncbi:hypothetical protein KC19_9G090500 [Ceratodon purpureus]|uniref:dCMP deaminase n=1 Tax=Ceratodon purpureus TaxID=3225 RepID=A0A8T0GS09_CERPU|nr:hypothetical protein KC19_9G090500 [Ceratodon purpureus]
MEMSVSRRELVLVSAAAGALGGGLVALAFTVGGRSRGASRRRLNDGGSEEADGLRWLKLRLLRTFSLQSGGEDVGISRETPPAPPASDDIFMEANEFSSSKLHSSRQSLYLSAQNSEVEGFEDVGTLLKSGDLDLLIDHPLSIVPQALTVADKPDPYNPSKRKGYMSWDDYFMAIAFLSAKRSKDPNRQVGACIVSQDRVILGIGYNGFPRGCSDDNLPWAKKSATGDPLQTKYPYVCHAEVNAILNKNHASASGQRLYVTLFPCNECAKIIIQAGIAEVVYFTDKGPHVENDPGGTEPAYIASRRLLSMAGIKVWQHQPADKMLVLEFR